MVVEIINQHHKKILGAWLPGGGCWPGRGAVCPVVTGGVAHRPRQWRSRSGVPYVHGEERQEG
jgi:hypothetical protein